MAERRNRKWIVLTGGTVGLLVWVYDYDFFLNAGGPATPVSKAILKTLHLQATEHPLPQLVPLLVLIVAGAAIAAGLNWLLRVSAPPR